LERNEKESARKSMYTYRSIVVVVSRSLFSTSLSLICIRVIIFLRSAMETHTQERNIERHRAKVDEENHRDVFYRSAAFGTSSHINK
jgi:hypothetical protein